MYKNYHKHDHYGNPWVMDVAVKPEDYCKRAVELGHDTVFTVNHGVTGNIFDWMEQSKKYNLKMCYGTEAYYVKDRFEKDESSKDRRHLIIIAKNNDGVLQLNDIMTEAHMTGFYFRPRIDRGLLFSLDPKNFIITTACVAGIWEDAELILALNNQFQGNFFLELQNHNIPLQKLVNEKMLNLHEIAGIPIIHANDSHYIYPEDSKYRDILLRAKGIVYEEENKMVLDYPDEDTIYERYEKQGVCSRQIVAEMLDNTNVFDECEPITIINDDIKLPSISDNPTGDLRKLIDAQWNKEKQNVPQNRWSEYEKAIDYELDIVEKTHMENYFLIDYIVAKNGQEKYGGKITNTGRGSAPSFYITKLLGLTNIDRISAPITLFPTRFMSVERIIASRNLPDIDLNMADREPFIKATEDLLGKENCAWMLTWKPMQNSEAFRTYCRGIGMDINDYDEIAKNIESYEEDKKWGKIIEESKRFRGVVVAVSESPCSMLLYYKPVRKELGLVRTNANVYCCLLDGINCDKYKYLKNDYLSVIVWSMIRSTCELAKIPIPTIRELDNLLDEKTFDIYKNKLTCTINQADSDWATELVARYQPHSVEEMSAFVAIIRPGCASLLQDFIDRKPYTTGVKELDDLLAEGNHRMIYQELIMRYLIWLGVAETGSYDIIKKIAKKKFKEPELAELKKILLQGWINEVGTKKGFEETWQIVENAARYSFNACVSGDTKIQKAGNTKSRFVPTVEEMYLIMNDAKYARKTNHFHLHQKYRSNGYGNALSMCADGRIRINKIIDIRQSGIRDIYRITTESGTYLDCTMNHKFPTPNGKKQLSEIKVGDKLFIKGDYEVHYNDYRFTNGEWDSNIPKPGEKGFQERPDGNSVKFRTKLLYCQTHRLPCEKCDKVYDDSKFELHHIDHDRTNNEDENLMWLCNSCHKKAHYKSGRRKCFEKGIPTITDKVVSIKYLRTDQTYDIEMADPSHTFVSESGLVTSNSHSLSYAYDSLYGAYLKSHYPLEYYTVALNSYRDDSARTTRLTKELEYFNIKLKPVKFRHSRADYSMSKSENSIYKGISSIKNLNAKCAEEMYELREKQYDDFISVLYDLKEFTSINSKQINILIELDFFEEFGDRNLLKQQYLLFDKFADRKTFKKEEIDSLGIPLVYVREFAGKESEKQFSQMNMSPLIHILADHIEYTPHTLNELIEAQVEYLGYVDIPPNPRFSGYAVVLDIDTKFSPKVKLHSLKNGTLLDCKINKKTFKKTPLEKGNVIKIQKVNKKPKVHKDESGKWVEVPGTSELWVSDYFLANLR